MEQDFSMLLPYGAFACYTASVFFLQEFIILMLVINISHLLAVFSFLLTDKNGFNLLMLRSEELWNRQKS